MQALKFTLAAILIVFGTLQLFGMASIGLALAVGEMTDIGYAIRSFTLYLLLAAASAYGGYRLLRQRPAAGGAG
ncbi:MAG: hypothetical protein HY017_33935 [Betaproteobacteria bacterium]|nr:hypothetical protein [Betaproteobacteria bacterium]